MSAPTRNMSRWEAAALVQIGDVWKQNAWPAYGRLVKVCGVRDGRVFLVGNGDLDARWFVGRFRLAERTASAGLPELADLGTDE